MPTGIFSAGQTLSKVKIPYIDKWIHGILFFILIYLWQWYFYKIRLKNLSSKMTIHLFTIMLFYGIIIEIFQWLLPVARTADIYDVFADGLGAMLGILAFQLFKNKIHS